MSPHRLQEPEVSACLEPIAIIGMGCRWPGDSESPSELWNFLQAKKDGYGRFPADRINVDSFYHPDSNRPGSFYTEGGCFLSSNVRNIDHTFFGIHPREVASLDPAQRKFLEVVYETFESAGVPLERIAGSKTGTFVGNFNYDHQLMQYRDAEYPEPYAVTGGGITVLSNRINYIFDLKGPSMTLDTACSSSMYALHMACEAIYSGDCVAAIVGGSNLILTPECQVFSSALGAVSPTSRCHTFDIEADGYARADGIGALYIKKLSEAVKDRDPIRAVIRATAVNANGKTGGITHPSPDGQEAVMRRAYERAGNLDPTLTTYFECHGTGTAVGDPIETEAIGRVFAKGRSAENPLYIGSIKTNLGHREPSSGIAGIMKAVLALEHGIIPATIGLKTLNPNVNLWDGALSIVTESTPWPSTAEVRRASVNSFGYGGANAHTILESIQTIVPGYSTEVMVEMQRPLANGVNSNHLHSNGISVPGKMLNGSAKDPYDTSTSSPNGSSSSLVSVSTTSSRRSFMVPFTAHDERTLRKNIDMLSQVDLSDSMGDLAYTLSSRRSILSHRSFAVLSSDDLKDSLTAAKDGTVQRAPSSSPKLGFIFTGQGAQWPQMGMTLLEEFPRFAATIHELDNYIQAANNVRTWTLENVLRAKPEDSMVNDAEISQPIVTAVQIGIVDILRSWKINPSAVTGHSSGEIAASYAAGLSTKREAMLSAYFRGKAVTKNQSKGLMLAVGLGASEAEKFVLPHQNNVTIACHNSPSSCTLSGDVTQITAIKETLTEQKIFARELKTGGNAYHSHHMKALGNAYEEHLNSALGKMPPRSCLDEKKRESLDDRPIFFSSVFGSKMPRSILGPRYWRANLESPVLFSQSAAAMIESMELQLVVEIGPHSALQGPFRQILQTMSNGTQVEYLPSIVRNGDNVKDMLTLAGNLFSRGLSIDLEAVNGLEKCKGRTVVDLPHYAWQYSDTPIISENRWTKEWRLREHPRHDILGSRIPGGVKLDPTWRNILRMQDVPWIAHHCIGKDAVMPSAGYIAMALEAATQMMEVSGVEAYQIESLEIQDMTLTRALLLNEDSPVETLFNMRPVLLNGNEYCESRFEFHLVSVEEEQGKSVFVEHCRGNIEVEFEARHMDSQTLLDEYDGLKDFHKLLNVSSWYERFSQVGLCYGPSFQGLLQLRGVGTLHMTGAHIESHPPVSMMKHESRYVIHPSTLDAALQLSMIAAHGNKVHLMKQAYMPTKIESMLVRPHQTLSKDPSNLVARAAQKGIRGLTADLTVRGHNVPLLEIKNIFFIASTQNVSIPEVGHTPYTRMVWKPWFSDLDDEKIASLYPPITLKDGAVIPLLNTLALHQLIDFRLKNDATFKSGSKEPHLHRLLQWTEDKLAAARVAPDSLANKIFSNSQEWREEEIARRSEELNSQSSESRLMCHLYNNLADIYSGEKSGIQVALQNNLLVDNYEHGQVYREGNKRLAKVVELLAHERPGLRILELGAGTGSATREVLSALHGDTAWRKYSRYHFTDITSSFLADAETKLADYGGMTFGTFDMERDAQSQGYEADWDLVIASNVVHATSNIKKTLENVRGVLKPGGHMLLLELTQSQLSAGLVLGTFSDFWKGDVDPEFPRYDGPFLSKEMWRAVLPSAGFSGLDFHLDDYAGENRSATVICATATDEQSKVEEAEKKHISTDQHGISLVYRHETTALVDATAQKLLNHGLSVDRLPVESCGSVLDIRYKRVVFLLESEKPFFTNVTDVEWKGFQHAAISASSALWVSAGSLMQGGEPAFAMISGIVRGLKTELSHLRFGTLDTEPEDKQSIPNLVLEYEQKVYESQPGDDVEFRRHAGMTHISRLVQDSKLNEESLAVHESRLATEDVPLSQLDTTPFRLDIEKPGVLSSLYFREDQDFTLPLGDDEVEVKVLAAGINNKDIAVVTGKHHSDSFSDECAGVISKVGKGVQSLQPGDRVQCMSFARMGNYVRDRAAFCSKMNPSDTPEQAATLPIAFGTAIYGLMELGRLQQGESVLIQSATGAVGLAAIQIAKHCGAEIFATVGTQDKKQTLLELECGIREDHIFYSRERRTVDQLMTATKGRGIDVVLCSARGQLMHDYWKCIAPSGRFVEIGRTEVLEGGSVNLAIFQRNATFTSFDLEVLSKTKPAAIANIMRTISELRASGAIAPLPHAMHHLSEIDKALALFAKAVHIGKLVLSYEQDDTKPIRFRRSPYKVVFDPDASYLLVGCLGGLGRSFSKWAVQRGARSFIYLSRSGARSAEAKEFLDSLRSQGIDVTVALGDVAKLADVQAAVNNATRPIKGVIQGALTLNDGLFESISLPQFKATVAARVTGTQNLHTALINQPLDFFQMWSSWTLMFGTATQSNYLASNAFMDAFARYRRSLGLPATSLSLSQVLGVGIVSYLPEYQRSMIRNGFYGNNEDEFLAYCEAGIERPPPPLHIEADNPEEHAYDPAADSHLLVGIEPAGLLNVDKTYPLSDMIWASDPRFSLLLQAVERLKTDQATGNGAKGDDADMDGVSPAEQIKTKISRLLYVPEDDIAIDKPINAYGIDSMVAAELRNWLYAKFEEDVTMLNLLSTTTTIEKLEELVVDGE